MTWLPPAAAPVGLLMVSNVFMTFAWYGHLKFTDRPLWIVVLVSWSIALIEYCFAVPANRLGHTVYSAAVQVDNDLGRYFEPADGRSVAGGIRWRM